MKKEGFKLKVFLKNEIKKLKKENEKLETPEID